MERIEDYSKKQRRRDSIDDSPSHNKKRKLKEETEDGFLDKFSVFFDPILHLARSSWNFLQSSSSTSAPIKKTPQKQVKKTKKEEKKNLKPQNLENSFQLSSNFRGISTPSPFYPSHFPFSSPVGTFQYLNNSHLFSKQVKMEERRKDPSQLCSFLHDLSLNLDEKKEENREEEREVGGTEVNPIDLSIEDDSSFQLPSISFLPEEKEEEEEKLKLENEREEQIRRKWRNRSKSSLELSNQEEADQLREIEITKGRVEKIKRDRKKGEKESREGLKRRMEREKAGVFKFSDEEKEKIELFMTSRKRETDVLSEKYNQKITRGDLSTLKGTNWLNDEVINFYMNILTERNNNNQDSLPKCEFFNTFFYPMLAEKGYERVKKWTRKVDVFSKDKVIVPIHLGMHWCLAVVNFREKRFEYYDSLGGSSTRGTVLKNLRKWVEAEYLDKKKEKMDLSEWTDTRSTFIPQQLNGYDCGVFTCRFADCASQDKPFLFSQEHMKHFRKRIILDILQKEYTIKDKR